MNHAATRYFVVVIPLEYVIQYPNILSCFVDFP